MSTPAAMKSIGLVHAGVPHLNKLMLYTYVYTFVFILLTIFVRQISSWTQIE